MKFKTIYYFSVIVIYLGLCLLCDVLFGEQFTGTRWESVLRSATFLIAVFFAEIAEKKYRNYIQKKDHQ